MSKNIAVRVLNVFLNEVIVGQITRLTDERSLFAFDASYLENQNRPTLSLSFKATDGSLLRQTKLYSMKLPPFFSNLLPEGHLRTYLAEKLHINAKREFFLLAQLADDLPGAVRIESDGGLSDSEIAELADENSAETDALRFSLAGVQLKFSAVLENNGRITIPVKGTGGSWIIKLPSGNMRNLPEVEYAMMLLAEKAGIQVPEIKMIPTREIANLPEEFQSETGESFATKRFDRTDNGHRIHMEDFAQVFGMYSESKYKGFSYAQIAEVLAVEAGQESVTEFIRRLVFTVAIGNGDMHLKNWSLLYKDERNPVLSPAYDFIPTIAFLQKQTLGLTLGGTKSFDEVTMDSFKEIAIRALLPSRLVTKTVRESVESIASAWEEWKADLPISHDIAHTIDSHIKSLPLFKSQSIQVPTDLKNLKSIVDAVILDDEIDDDKIMMIETRTGLRQTIIAPEHLKTWVLEARILAEAPGLAQDAPLTVLLGDTLYRKWRAETFISLSKAVLSTSFWEDRTTEDKGHISGEFSPQEWRKIANAYENRHTVSFDMSIHDGEIRTFDAVISKIVSLHRLKNQLTESTFQVAIKNNRIILRQGEVLLRRSFRMDDGSVWFSLEKQLDNLGWSAAASENRETVLAWKQIPTKFTKGVQATVKAEIKRVFNGRKTVLTVSAVVDDYPKLVHVAKGEIKALFDKMTSELKEFFPRQIWMPTSSIVVRKSDILNLKQVGFETSNTEMNRAITEAFNSKEPVELIYPLDSVFGEKPIVMNALISHLERNDGVLKVFFKLIGESAFV